MPRKKTPPGFGPPPPKGPQSWPQTGPAPEPAEPPAFQPTSKTRWVIYGVFVDERGTKRAITDENLMSEEEGAVKLVTYYMTKGRSLAGVLIRLDNGKDVNGERHVIRRAGEGRAWWE